MVDNFNSSAALMSCGVPQGSVLSLGFVQFVPVAVLPALNFLPLNTDQTVPTFKKLLKTHLYKLAFYNI